MFRATAISILFSVFVGAAAQAQEKGPSIIPERLQQIALTTPLADRLHVNWESASPTEIGQYMGLLAAINQASISPATRAKNKFCQNPGYCRPVFRVTFLLFGSGFSVCFCSAGNTISLIA
ncbi:hypothetical protein FJ930_28675 [Mesorhizobium sp. B2-4-15]|uniref:hypothetical protein n=1 Tax=Mesorhizobium sp. B2-4-15 TaxID=2589934 RepID=UPI00115062EC|nr:hypothetical protein [Mesorhizobium sp. B2-4-15]TPK60142.1 hypothetical protein FJ930_28675 [Mesorhizobium sp. B2-4-15]